MGALCPCSVVLAAQAKGEPWVFFTILGLVLVGWAVAWAWDLHRRRHIVAYLAQRGMTGEPRTRTPEDVPEFDAALGNPLLNYERNHIPWHAAGPVNGAHLSLLEYVYYTGHGKFRKTHRHLILATPFPSPPMPITVQRKRWLKPHGFSEYASSMHLESHAFNAHCDIYSRDERAASIYLPLAAQQLLAQFDKRYWFRLANGKLIIGRRGRSTLATIHEATAVLERLVAAMMTQHKLAA